MVDGCVRVCVCRFDKEEEAVAIANSTLYGLASKCKLILYSLDRGEHADVLGYDSLKKKIIQEQPATYVCPMN